MMRYPCLLTRRCVGAAHLGIPGGEDAARVVATHPDVETPHAELGYLREALPQQGWRVGGRRNIGERHYVLHANEPKLSALFRLVEQQLGFEQTDSSSVLNETHLPIVEAHRTGARLARQ